MSKWKCEICNSEFDNFQAQGFNHQIYCPLCYFKELYKREKTKNDKDYLKMYQEIHKDDKTDEEIIEDLEQENKQLKEEIRKMKNSKPYKILKEWEEFIENKEVNNYTDFEYKNKLFELKEKYK